MFATRSCLGNAGADDTGHPQVDDAFAQARTWIREARNLNLLTIYEQRIQRSVDKNTAQLKAIQTERKDAGQGSHAPG